MCDCRRNLEQKLTARYASQMPEVKELDVRLAGYSFVIEGGVMKSRPVMPIEIRHTVAVKKTGAEKRKVKKSNMTFSFCPFCGEKLT